MNSHEHEGVDGLKSAEQRPGCEELLRSSEIPVWVREDGGLPDYNHY